MGRSETAAQVGIALKDTIGEKVGIDFAKQRSQVRMAGGEIRSSFHILNHLGVDQNARGCLMALHPRRDQRNSSRTGKEQCSQRRRVEQIAPFPHYIMCQENMRKHQVFATHEVVLSSLRGRGEGCCPILFYTPVEKLHKMTFLAFPISEFSVRSCGFLVHPL